MTLPPLPSRRRAEGHPATRRGAGQWRSLPTAHAASDSPPTAQTERVTQPLGEEPAALGGDEGGGGGVGGVRRGGRGGAEPGVLKQLRRRRPPPRVLAEAPAARIRVRNRYPSCAAADPCSGTCRVCVRRVCVCGGDGTSGKDGRAEEGAKVRARGPNERGEEVRERQEGRERV